MKNIQEDTVSDSIYEVGYFNSQGTLDRQKLGSHLLCLSFIVFMGTLFALYGLHHDKSNVLETLRDFYAYNASLFYSFIIAQEEFVVEECYITAFLTSLVPSILLPLGLFIYVRKNSKLQAALSSVGLSQYYFYRRKHKRIFLKFKKGCKNEYPRFTKERENLCQLLGVVT